MSKRNGEPDPKGKYVSFAKWVSTAKLKVPGAGKKRDSGEGGGKQRFNL